MAITLRPYQEKAVGEVRDALRAHPRVLLVSPTGSGKTRMFAYITDAASARGNAVTILAHRQEIVDQIGAALDEIGVRHGRIAAGHTMTDDPVQVAMVQTLARRLDRVRRPALLVVDEAHHGVAGSWQKITAAWAGIKILGVSATPERLDGRGLKDAFDVLVQGPTIKSLIGSGFLAEFDYFAPPTKIDLSEVKTRMGEYAIDQLAVAMDKAAITGDAVEHYREHLAGRPAIAFCCTVAHAEHVAAQFRAAGFKAASVDGAMDKARRRDAISALGDGRLNLLSSCDLISEGVDVPICAGAILLRPTKSLALHLQQCGRVLRPKKDGGKAVILDHVGNWHRHGPIDAERAWSLDGRTKKAAAPGVRQCKTCFIVIPAGTRPDCADTACPLLTADAEARALPEQVAGKLERVAAPSDIVTFDWAGGIDVLRAQGPEWKALLARAEGDRGRLQQIAKARKYHHAWVDRVLAGGRRAA